MATDDDLNTTGRPAFTKDTEPGIGTYVYVDMRGNLWAVVWDVGSATWSTSPVDAVYGMPAGKLAFFGERGDLLIDAIERHAEEWRVETKAARAAAVTAAQPPVPAKSDNGGAWLALLALGLLLWEADRK
jgi:hypothetical protein